MKIKTKSPRIILSLFCFVPMLLFTNLGFSTCARSDTSIRIGNFESYMAQELIDDIEKNMVQNSLIILTMKQLKQNLKNIMILLYQVVMKL